MLLLVTDTSGRQGSVALVRADEQNPNQIETIEQVPLAGGTFSAQLVPQISSLLTQHGFGKGDIAAFIVVSGPGSFTGLRVGLAAIKALAEILHKPIVPISLLEVIATECQVQGRVLAVLDAGRSEFYVGEYKVTSNTAQMAREQLLSTDEFLSAANHSKVITPDARVAALVEKSGVSVLSTALPSAQAIARVGYGKLQAGESVSPEQLEANYIRRSDAEIFSKTTP
jgi:tRNA threonylcarbamoyladenosine biosynthesis protein TsaB